MSSLSRIFRRIVGGGWLIVSGPSPSNLDQGFERLLEAVDLSRPILFLRPENDLSIESEQWAFDIGELLEIPLTPLDPGSVNAGTLISSLLEAGLVLAAGGDESFWLDTLKTSLGSPQTDLAFNAETILWFTGAAGMVLGQWTYVVSMDEIMEGMGWLPGAILQQQESGQDLVEAVRWLLRNQSRSYALNLVGGATLALGLGGEIELWGEPNPAIVLGKGWVET